MAMKGKTGNPAGRAGESEKLIERYLARRVAEAGGVCLKYSNAGMTGYPDRICLLPGGLSFWVELKSKGERPRLLQRMRLDRLARLGHKAYVCDSREAVDEVMGRYERREA